MSKHEQNSQNFANQNKTSSKDPRENEGSVNLQAAKARGQTRSSKKGDNGN